MHNRIKAIRKHHRLSQATFGARLGVKQTTVAGWESGIRTPSGSSQSLLCKEFSVDISWLRTGEGSMIQETRDSSTLADPLIPIVTLPDCFSDIDKEIISDQIELISLMDDTSKIRYLTFTKGMLASTRLQNNKNG